MKKRWRDFWAYSGAVPFEWSAIGIAFLVGIPAALLIALGFSWSILTVQCGGFQKCAELAGFIASPSR